MKLFHFDKFREPSGGEFRIHKPPGKNQAIELLRIVAAFGIIWFHSKLPEFGIVSYGGLVIFLTFSSYFAAIAPISRPDYLLRLGKRLLLPWAAWWLVYGALNLADHRPLLLPHHDITLGVLTGTHIHLWYLPFIFAVVTGITALKQKLNTTTITYGAFALALALIVSSPFWTRLAPLEPLSQYLNASAPIFAGIVLGQSKTNPRAKALFVILLIGCGVMMFHGAHDHMEPYLAGFLLVAGAIVLGDRLTPKWMDVSPMSNLTLGIYLIHPIYMSVAKPLLVHGGTLYVVAVFTLSAITAAIGTWAMRKIAGLFATSPAIVPIAQVS